MQIFIDLDGPLLDVTRRYYLIYSDLMRKAGNRPFDQESYWSLKRLSVRESAIVQRCASRQDTVDYLQKRQQLLEDPAYLLYDRLQPGVAETLDGWFAEHELYLVTLRRDGDALLSQLNLLGIRSYFKKVFCADNVEPSWKIKCEWMRSIRSRLGDAVVIGDTEVDVLAGRAAGLRTVALSCGIRSRRLLEQLVPDLMLGALRDLDLEKLRQAWLPRSTERRRA
jgi:phosphoglycolate phosphatase-like HAD superfamily hydrolase